MNAALLVTILLCAVIALSAFAKRIGVPYPVALVIGGTVLAFIPGLPEVSLDPNVVFLVVLPPLLFGAAWRTDWFEFKRNAQPISLLALGLVVFTTVIVAVVAHALRPDTLSWPLAFVLGAVVAPPDAVAADAILARLAVPRRIAAILTGESLVNDASALVLYRFAIAAVVFGTFSFVHAIGTFFVVAIGGIAVGLIVALLIDAAYRLLNRAGSGDAPIVNAVTLVAPYLAYLPAEALHVSGVLSAVAAGIFLGRRSAVVLGSEARLVGASVWEVFSFVLNGFVFVVIGLELRTIVHSLAANSSALDGPVHIALDAIVISVLVILIRLVWVFPATYLPRMFSKRIREHEPKPSWRAVLIVAWTGMRGIVSLASALAIPTFALGGVRIVARDEMVFIAFCVIFATLVLQGLTLAPLIKRLGVTETSTQEAQETKVRIHALEAGVQKLHSLEHAFATSLQWESAGRLLGEYQQRIAHLQGHLDAAETDEPPENAVDHQLQREALQAERHAILSWRRAGKIPDEIFRNIEYDLDLADLRLD